MPILNPSSLMFLITLMTGTVMALSSSSWFMCWVGLELNTLSFIPLILLKLKRSSIPSEAALMYFLVQAAGSTILLMGSMLCPFTVVMAKMTITAALLLKMGAAPLHLWLPRMMQGLNWWQCFTLMTIQKFAPLGVISYTLQPPSMSHIIISASICSALFGSVGGLNQTLMRKILAYSSINHMGWMLSAVTLSSQLWTFYLMIYTAVTQSLILFLNQNQIFHLKQLSVISLNQSNKIMLFLGFFSLGGLPPFLGFLPKLSVVSELVEQQQILLTSILLLSSLITLYYYVRIILLALTFPVAKTSVSLRFHSKINYGTAVVLLVNTIPVLAPALLMYQF